uniref:Uncharacterized protein n=1 Tax=Rhizophora mucronata TaxID=61149 RepID=A0A2P2N1Z1_RHIMU
MQKVNLAEMRMFRWICGHSRNEQIRSENICRKVPVALIGDKLRV